MEVPSDFVLASKLMVAIIPEFQEVIPPRTELGNTCTKFWGTLGPQDNIGTTNRLRNCQTLANATINHTMCSSFIFIMWSAYESHPSAHGFWKHGMPYFRHRRTHLDTHRLQVLLVPELPDTSRGSEKSLAGNATTVNAGTTDICTLNNSNLHALRTIISQRCDPTLCCSSSC